MRRLWIGLVAASLAACGTTVPLAQQASTVGSSDGLSSPTSSATAPGTSGQTDAGSTGAVTDPGGSLTAPSSSNGSTGGSTPTSLAPTTGSSAPSVTGTVPQSVATSKAPVKVGVLFLQGADQLAASLGISGLSTGDATKQGAAIISWMSAHGGLAGRKISPYYYGIPSSDAASNLDGAYQAACTSLTQDDKVQFVVSYVNPTASAISCFAKAGVTFIDDTSLVADAVQGQYKAHFSAPGDFAPGRLMKQLVDELWRTGWLTAKSKVGSYTYDTKENNALVNGALTAALKAHGLSIVKKAAVAMTADAVTQSSSASLAYRAAGVDRIIPISASPLFVMEAASSQKYYPQYALYSSFGPGALLESTAPKDQLKGAAGIGWQPYLDIGAGTHPGPVSSNETLCMSIMKGAGQQSSSATVKGFQVYLCDALFFLKAASDKLGSVPPDVLARAATTLGATYKPADTFRTDVTHRVDGAAGYRDLAFQQACSCFQYVSPVRAAE